MSSLSEQQVLGVRHWTDTLFSFKTTREASFRYQSGQFVMIGLEVNGRPLLRAYSLASAHYEEELEFFSIKVPDGPLTSRLQHIAPGRPHPGRPQGDGNAAARQSAARPQPLPRSAPAPGSLRS